MIRCERAQRFIDWIRESAFSKAAYRQLALALALVAFGPWSTGAQPNAVGCDLDACFKACPNNLSLRCYSECDKRGDECRRRERDLRKSEVAAVQCLHLPSSSSEVASEVDRA